MRGAGGPVTLNIQSFSEKSKHPFTRLDKNRPSFRVNTGRLSQARALRVRRLSIRSGGARKTKGDPRLRGDDIRLKPGGDFPLQNKIQSNRQGILDCSNGR